MQPLPNSTTAPREEYGVIEGHQQHPLSMTAWFLARNRVVITASIFHWLLSISIYIQTLIDPGLIEPRELAKCVW